MEEFLEYMDQVSKAPLKTVDSQLLRYSQSGRCSANFSELVDESYNIRLFAISGTFWVWRQQVPL